VGGTWNASERREIHKTILWENLKEIGFVEKIGVVAR
jgi:hypothetical protein